MLDDIDLSKPIILNRLKSWGWVVTQPSGVPGVKDTAVCAFTDGDEVVNWLDDLMTELDEQRESSEAPYARYVEYDAEVPTGTPRFRGSLSPSVRDGGIPPIKWPDETTRKAIHAAAAKHVREAMEKANTRAAAGGQADRPERIEAEELNRVGSVEVRTRIYASEPVPPPAQVNIAGEHYHVPVQVARYILKLQRLLDKSSPVDKRELLNIGFRLGFEITSPSLNGGIIAHQRTIGTRKSDSFEDDEGLCGMRADIIDDYLDREEG